MTEPEPSSWFTHPPPPRHAAPPPVSRRCAHRDCGAPIGYLCPEQAREEGRFSGWYHEDPALDLSHRAQETEEPS